VPGTTRHHATRTNERAQRKMPYQCVRLRSGACGRMAYLRHGGREALGQMEARPQKSGGRNETSLLDTTLREREHKHSPGCMHMIGRLCMLVGVMTIRRFRRKETLRPRLFGRSRSASSLAAANNNSSSNQQHLLSLVTLLAHSAAIVIAHCCLLPQPSQPSQSPQPPQSPQPLRQPLAP